MGNNIVLDEPEDFFCVCSDYEIYPIGKFKSYDAAFAAGEDIAFQNGEMLLLYFIKATGIEMFNEFLTYLEGKK